MSAQRAQKISETFDQLAPAFMNVKPDLGDQRISKRKLSESEAGYRELADTEKTDKQKE